MEELLVAFIIFVAIFFQFMLFGISAKRIARLKIESCETIIVGFFCYFGVFQIVALPLILLYAPFHILYYSWLGVCIIADAYVMLFERKNLYDEIRRMVKSLRDQKLYLLVLVLLCVLGACYFHAVQPYVSWDTSYYIGTVNTTLYTDTMYVYNGNSGVKEGVLPLRYALSSFYMQSAFLCRLGHVSALVLQKYVMGSVCICMHSLIVFLIGKKIFRKNSAWALMFLVVELLLNYGFRTIYTTSTFLLIRGYEAKGYCSNVIIPALFYMALCLWKDARRRDTWVMLFIICFSSVPVSMSAIMIAPAMVAIMLAAELVVKRDFSVIWKGLICVIPNGIYLIAYFLHTLH